MTVGFSLSLKLVSAVWQSPTADPPNGNVPDLINVSTSTQSKEGSLILNTIGDAQGLVVDKGNFGIGVIIPAARLDVAGGIKLGSDFVCNSNKEGTIRYSSTSKSIEFCNATDWIAIELECVPNCPPSNGCGDDGCGGSCGTCPAPSSGANYCHSSGNVYHDVTSYTCNSSNTCIPTVTPTLVATCSDGCSGGTCCSDPCSGGYDCGTRTNACGVSGNCGTCPTSTTGSNYCNLNSVYHDITSWSCNNNVCTSAVTPTLVQTCSSGYTCVSGTCVGYLVNNIHTFEQCTAAGGTVYNSGTIYFCRFNGSGCPGGWTQYGNWSTTAENCCTQIPTCASHPNCSWDRSCCYTGGHAWANTSPSFENCIYYATPCVGSPVAVCSGPSLFCYSTVTQRGCY